MSLETKFSNNILRLFIDGFKLLNQHIEVYLLFLAINIIEIPLSRGYFTSEPVATLGKILFAISVVISYGYLLMIPAFLELEGKNIFLQTLILFRRNLGRIFVATITLFVIVIITLVIIAFSLYFWRDSFSLTFLGEIYSLFQSRDPSLFHLVVAVLASFLTFMTIFFSIERKNIIQSVVKSITFSFTHLRFVLVIALISFVFTSIISYIISYETVLGSILFSIPSFYFYLWVTATAVLFYKETRRDTELL